MGPWDYWHERWTNLLRDLETSYWARVSEWDALVDLHRELLSFLAQARALGLPHVPDDLPMPTGPTGPGSTLGDLGGALDKGGQHIENILGKLLIGLAQDGFDHVWRQITRSRKNIYGLWIPALPLGKGPKKRPYRASTTQQSLGRTRRMARHS
jgi:hypothetical protein